MKGRKRVIKIISIIIILLMVSGVVTYSYGATVTDKIGNIAISAGSLGLGGILSFVIQIGALAIATAINTLMLGFTGIKGIGATAIKCIVFNDVDITTPNFFSNTSDKSAFAANIQLYYSIIRNLSIALLLFILLYIGIRMAISTVADEEAKYKKMFKNWAVSLLLVFVLQYIMIATLAVNNALVEALKTVANTNNLDTFGTKFIHLVVERNGSSYRMGRSNSICFIYNSFSSNVISIYKTCGITRIFNCYITINYGYIFNR